MTIKRIAVVGANGFVGKAICESIEDNSKYELIRIIRSDNLSEKIKSADIVIHAANPGGRIKADNNPQKDFEETVEKTYDIINKSQGKKLILISATTCRVQTSMTYSRHRRSCELLTVQAGGIVLRVGYLFGKNKKNDVLHDILDNRTLYITPETEFAWVDVNWFSDKVIELIDIDSGIYELGAYNAVTADELCKTFNSTSKFGTRDDSVNPLKELMPKNLDYPDARAVFDFAKQELSTINEWGSSDN